MHVVLVNAYVETEQVKKRQQVIMFQSFSCPEYKLTKTLVH
jgi:hypothetical protein